MARERTQTHTLRFAEFEACLDSGELLRGGRRVALQQMPFALLALLLESAGRVVTREQIRARLWPDGTHVDFEHGVNTALKKLRRALQDSPQPARFVETLPKRGYRFLAPVVGRGSTRRPGYRAANGITRIEDLVGRPWEIPAPALPNARTG